MARHRCKKDHCLVCELKKCVLDMSEEEYREYKSAKKKEYLKEYYQKNKVDKQIYNHEAYLARKYGNEVVSRVQYVKWVDLKKAVYKLKKQIGEVNCDLVLDAIEELDKEKIQDV